MVATRRGDELPAELQRREERLQRIREARKRAWKTRPRQEAERAGRTRSETGQGNKPSSRKEASSPKSRPGAQYNFTDPESRIMKGPDGFVQGYNAQIAVDGAAQIIVAVDVIQQTTRQRASWRRWLEQAEQKPTSHTPTAPIPVTDQPGNEKSPSRCLSSGGPREAPSANGGEPTGPPPEGVTRADRMRRKLQSKWSAPFMHAQSHRGTGVRTDQGGAGIPAFSLRGLNKVRGEWSLVCMAHNVLKFHRLVCL